MQNYKIGIMTSKAFNVKAHTAQEALDFILHAHFNSDIVNTNNENTQFALFSCQSDDGKDSGEYIAVRNGNGFDIMDISAIPLNQ